MTDYDKATHLQMIQGVISRLAGNSFQFKAWTITLASAFVAGALTVDEKDLAIMAAVPVIAFWYLDAVFLANERRFRELYRMAAQGELSVPYDMDPSQVMLDRCKVKNVIRSPTLCYFYLPCLLTLLAIFFALMSA